MRAGFASGNFFYGLFMAKLPEKWRQSGAAWRTFALPIFGAISGKR
jgi:hypothetical protein